MPLEILRSEIKRLKQAAGKPGMTHESAQDLLIEPLLHCLGWNPKNTNIVRKEVRIKKNGKRTDYLLLGRNRKSMAILEYKKYTLTPPPRRGRDMGEADIYAFECNRLGFEYANYTGIAFFIITDGITWQIYGNVTDSVPIGKLLSFDILNDDTDRVVLLTSCLQRDTLCDFDGRPAQYMRAINYWCNNVYNRLGNVQSTGAQPKENT